MIPVTEALDRIFALVAPIGSEAIPLRAAAGRVLSAPVSARHDQPPFAASAMDGYAVTETASGAAFEVIGTSAAGHPFTGALGPGQAVRIFTGAPVPAGASRIVIQEDVTRDGERIRIGDGPDEAPYIRPAGNDFARGDEHFPRAPLRPADLALIAAMGAGEVTVARRPEVALIATGDELVAPGTPPGPGQIVASNALGLAAQIEGAGGRARILPIARDTEASLAQAFDLAAGADLVVTIGGASVGDHDLVADAAAQRGGRLAFHKVAMRPGKPLMAGRIDGIPMVGLPGNPVSSMVCGTIFILPALRVMLGLGAEPAPRAALPLRAPLPANGPREHYMRAVRDGDGVRALGRQDSALLSVLTAADRLIVRPPHATPAQAGQKVDTIQP